MADTPEGDSSRERLQALLLSSLSVAESAVSVIARRNRLRPHEREELSSEVKLALVANEYAVLRKFEGRSSLRSYLVTVVARIFVDRQRHLNGKWRPSAAAQRLGVPAVVLERLLRRDGMSLDDAVARLLSEGTALPAEELRSIAAKLPSRWRPRPAEGLSDPEQIAAGPGCDPHDSLESRELRDRVSHALAAALNRCPPEDRLILRLHFERGLSVAEVARSLGLDQKRLYRHLEKLLQGLRRELEGGGLSWAEVETRMEDGVLDLTFQSLMAETAGLGPSPTTDGA